MKTIKRLTTAVILAMFLTAPVMAGGDPDCPLNPCQEKRAIMSAIFSAVQLLPPDDKDRIRIEAIAEREKDKFCTEECGKVKK